MATLPKTGTVTYEEWLQMPAVNAKEEVVNGEIRIVPPNKLPHANIVDNLTALFHKQLDRSVTLLYASTFGLVIRREPLTCRTPDMVLFERSTMVVEDGFVHSAPQFGIEVLSPSERRPEITEKLRDYESIGTAEVWLVSPEAATVEVLVLDDGELRRSAIVAEGVLQPKHFPAVQIDIAEIWPD